MRSAGQRIAIEHCNSARFEQCDRCIRLIEAEDRHGLFSAHEREDIPVLYVDAGAMKQPEHFGQAGRSGTSTANASVTRTTDPGVPPLTAALSATESRLQMNRVIQGQLI